MICCSHKGNSRWNVPARYGEAKGIFSFEKRMSPRPPKEKRGGISISPRTPLKRHKGAGCGPPLWKPFLGEGDGPRLWKPLLGMGSGSGKRSRGCPICTLRFDATISTAYKAGQALHPARDLVRNSSPAQQFSQNPFPPNLHLCASLEQTLFLFHRARRIFFLMSQKENGGCVPAAVRRVPLRSKENVRNIPMGKAHLGLQFRMVSPCSLVPHSGTFPSQFINQFMVNQKERSSWQSI